MGIAMAGMAEDDPTRLLLTRMHVLVGITTALLTVLRLVFIAKGPRPEPLKMSKLHHFGIKGTHVVLYVMLFAILGSGLSLFGGGELAAYLSGASATAPDFSELPPRAAHGNLPIAYIAVVLAHVAGSVLHELRHGGVFRRIGIPRRG